MVIRRIAAVMVVAMLALFALLVWGLKMTDAVKPERLGGELSVVCITFSPDGKWLAAAVYVDALPDQEAPQLVVWDLATRKPVFSQRTKGRQIHAIAFSADGRTMAAGGHELATTLWETVTWKERTHLPWDVSWVGYLAFHPSLDRLFAAAGGKRALLRVWDVPPRKDRFTQTLSGSWMGACALSPDGKKLVTVSDSVTQVWDANSGEEIWSFKGHPHKSSGDIVTCTTFLPDSRTFATGGYDSAVRLWDLSTKKQTAKFIGEVPVPGAIDISADGKVLAVAGEPKGDGDFGLVELWDLATGKHLARLKAPGRAVTCVKFSPDGKWLATGTDRTQKKGGGNIPGSLLLWNLSDVLGKKPQ
jgi:WD40 repeat protein